MEGEDESCDTKTEERGITAESWWGYRFHPLEEELFYYALQRAIEGPSDGEGIIFKECDLYGIEPMDLLREAKGGVVYVFTRLKKKTEGSTRIDRTVPGKGTWKEKDKAKRFYDQRKKIIGWRRGFSYLPNSKSTFMDEYRMKEYSLHDSVLSLVKFKDYVLCKIKKLKQTKKNEDGEDSQQAHNCLVISMSTEAENTLKLDAGAIFSSFSAQKLTPGTLSAPSQPGLQLEEFSNGDRALVPTSTESQSPPPSFPCTLVPLSCGRVSYPPVGSIPTFGGNWASHSVSTTPTKSWISGWPPHPVMTTLTRSRIISHCRMVDFSLSCGISDTASAAALTGASPSTAAQAEVAPVELSTKSGSYHQAAAQDSRHPESEFNHLPSATPSINPSPSPPFQTDPALNQSFNKSSDENDSLVWPTCVAAELPQFQSQPLEENDVQMLPNPMGFHNLEDMFLSSPNMSNRRF